MSTQSLVQLCKSVKTPVSPAAEAEAEAAAAVWDYRLQFHQRGCVVLQSPAISLFTEVKAVSCWVPEASIPIQWLIQACTGTLCNAVVSQYNVCKPSVPSSTPTMSHYEPIFFSYSYERIHPSSSRMQFPFLAVFLSIFRRPTFLILNIIIFPWKGLKVVVCVLLNGR